MKSLKKITLIISIFHFIIPSSSAQILYAGGSEIIGINGTGILNPDHTNSGAATNSSVFTGFSFYQNIFNFEVQYSHIHSDFTQGPEENVGEYSITRTYFNQSLKIHFLNSQSSPYFKFGMTISYPGIVQQDLLYGTFYGYPYNPSYGNPKGYITAFSQGEKSYGYLLAVGYNFKIIDHLCAFGELHYLNTDWTPNHSDVIDGGGADLSQFTIAQKQKNYVDFPTASNDPNKPTQVSNQKYNLTYTYFGIGIGIYFYIGKAKEGNQNPPSPPIHSPK